MSLNAAGSLHQCPYFIYIYEIEVMLVVMMSVFWGMMSFRLVDAFRGAPFLEGSPRRVICSEGMIIS